jgi:hypothetical protein
MFSLSKQLCIGNVYALNAACIAIIFAVATDTAIPCSWDSGLYYKHSMTIISDDRKRCLYYKSGVTLALALVRIVNYAPNCGLTH